MFYSKKLAAAKLRQWEGYFEDFRLPEWEELPDLGLYMDQVIILLRRTLGFLPEDEDSSGIVTASAINNYVRTRVMPPPEKKKYYRVHIAYLIMICSLKKSLGVQSVQKLVPTGLGEGEVQRLYGDYVLRHKAVARYFLEQARAAARQVMDPADTNENSVNNLIFTVAVASGFSKLLTEKLIALQDREPGDA